MHSGAGGAREGGGDPVVRRREGEAARWIGEGAEASEAARRWHHTAGEPTAEADASTTRAVVAGALAGGGGGVLRTAEEGGDGDCLRPGGGRAARLVSAFYLLLPFSSRMIAAGYLFCFLNGIVACEKYSFRGL